MLICTLLLVVSLVWALWDEAFGAASVARHPARVCQSLHPYLKSIKPRAGKSEAEIKETPEFQQLDAAATARGDGEHQRSP